MIARRCSYLFFDEDIFPAGPIAPAAPVTVGARPGALWWLDKTLKVPEALDPGPVKDLDRPVKERVVKARGRIVMPVMGLIGKAKVERSLVRAFGTLALEDPDGFGVGYLVSRNSVSDDSAPAEMVLSGRAIADEPDRRLAVLLGLESVEDFR